MGLEGEEEKEDGGGERKKSEMKPCFNMVETCCLDLVSSNAAIDALGCFDLQVYEREMESKETISLKLRLL